MSKPDPQTTKQPPIRFAIAGYSPDGKFFVVRTEYAKRPARKSAEVTKEGPKP